ncbi:MAG: hypothetical protein ACD_58C00288G0005 [uncultured bacterium]|nr:MAG: hypothetical protein ACD_58C00288G0005 [uncultured bacterium]
MKNEKIQFINSRTIAQTQGENLAATQVILHALDRKIKSKKDLLQIQKEVCEEMGSTFLTQPMLLNTYRELIKEKQINANDSLFQILRKRRIRTLSGVAPVAILTKPFPCPGKCIYCPSEPDMPKSYISNEPAVMRAILADFDPAKQIEIRLRGLEIAGNPTDKIELIVMGGTWSALPRDYQLKYIVACYRACNEFNNKSEARSTKSETNSKLELKNQKQNNNVSLDCARDNNSKVSELLQEQTKNEKAKYRIIGLTLETRPDYINEEEIKWMRMLGCTRVELGVQSIYDRVLNKNKRGHKVEATIKATKLLKDAGFKICYHMMPNLYGSNLKFDLQMFKELFSNPDFQPDMIKIYNCVVTKYSQLEKLVKSGKFISYTDEELIKLMIEIKQILPEYVRVLRLGRDIPADNIVCGSKMSNIRQIVQDRIRVKSRELKVNSYGCKCIRCREIREDTKLPVKLKRIDYDASDGKEIFLQYVDNNNRLYALLRLRIVTSDKAKFTAIIREVHTYGPMNQIGVRVRDKVVTQHQGLGKKLILEAERITKDEFGLNKITVISGVGVRDYYRKLGYNLEDTYMVKYLRNTKLTKY